MSREARTPLGRCDCPAPAARAGTGRALPELCFRGHHEASLPSCPAQTAKLLPPGDVTGAWGQWHRPQVGKVVGCSLQGPGQSLHTASPRPGADAGFRRPRVPGRQAALAVASLSRQAINVGRGIEQKGPLGAHPAGCFVTPGPCSAPGNSHLEGLPEASGPRLGPAPHGLGLAGP